MMRSSESTAPEKKLIIGQRKSPASQECETKLKTASKPSAASNLGKSSKLEVELARQLTLAGIPFIQELSPIPGRKFRFDFALKNLLVEVQGGIFKYGAHSSGAGITRDSEKSILAQLEGWRVFPVTGEQIKSGQALLWIQKALSIL